MLTFYSKNSCALFYRPIKTTHGNLYSYQNSLLLKHEFVRRIIIIVRYQREPLNFIINCQNGNEESVVHSRNYSVYPDFRVFIFCAGSFVCCFFVYANLCNRVA